MLYKVQISVLTALLALILISCNAKDPKASAVNNKRVDVLKKVEVENDKPDLPFDSLLENVNANIKGIWDPPIRMDGNKDFMVLYNNPVKYYDDFLRVMEDGQYIESKKMICVFAAQKLEFDKYLDFSNYCLQMFEKQNLSEDVLFFILFPNRWKTRLRFAEKYNDPRVHALFQRVLKRNDLSDRSKISLNHIYTGATWREHQSNLEKGFPE